jgi:hypothetical protein
MGRPAYLDFLERINARHAVSRRAIVEKSVDAVFVITARKKELPASVVLRDGAFDLEWAPPCIGLRYPWRKIRKWPTT